MTVPPDHSTHDPVRHESASDENPWPGLLAYSEADQKYFHGRKAEIDELFRLVMRKPQSLLFGISGLGKTSLIQAGLFPLLRQHRVLPIYIRLDYSAGHMGLTPQIISASQGAAAAVGAESPASETGDSLWAYFHRKEADFWSLENRLLMPLLVFDQFEELFTLGKEDAERAGASEIFIRQLGDLIEGRPPAEAKRHLDLHPEDAGAYAVSRHYYKVLISLREDFLANLEVLRQVMPSIFQNRMRLLRMNGNAALEVVAHARHLIEPSVAEEVVRFVAADDPALPLDKLELDPAMLSVLCRELNNRRQQLGDPKITRDLFQNSQEEILHGFYERSLADLGPEIRTLVEDKLLTVSGFRDSIALENALSIRGVTRQDIDRLVDRRLVRREDRAGVKRIELAHDILTRVISESGKERREIEAQKERETAFEQYQVELKEKEQMRRLEERAKSARRLRRWLIATVSMFIVAAVMGFTAYFQRNAAMKARAETERQREQAVEARAEAEEQREQAVLARAEAEKQRELAESRLNRITDSIALRQAVLSGHIDTDRWSKYISAGIHFIATATPPNDGTGSGKEEYKFEMSPDFNSIQGGFDAVAFITYRMNHSTFRNTLITTGPDRRFRASYDGWGCLNQVYALVEYDDVERDPALVDFNMCQLLDWQ